MGTKEEAVQIGMKITDTVEDTFFVRLADSMSPTAYVLAYLFVGLFLLHGMVLGVFLLNTMIDGTLTTASERTKTLLRTLGVILALQFIMVIIFAIIVFMNWGAV